jgi:pilus assembly protein Flp/PilA
MTALFAALHTLSFVVSDRLAAVKEEKGASMVEYALMVGLIAAAVAAAVGLFTADLGPVFESILPG